MIPFRDNVAARRYPLVTVSLIFLNIAVFLYELFLPAEQLEQLIFSYGAIPSRLASIFSDGDSVTTLAVVSLFTSMFLHGGFLHVIGNMWYLWIFGDNVEDRMGHLRFLGFYLLCGLIAGIIHAAFNISTSVPSIGASGAVAGVLGAYLISYPFARILTIIPLFLFWPIIELPAVLVLGSWFFIQFLYGTTTFQSASEATGGVAWWAHIGGFIAGIILIQVFATSPRRRRSG